MVTLRVYGKALDVDGFLRSVPFQPANVDHGERARLDFTVSEAGLDELPKQLADAERFLHEHGARLKAVSRSARASAMELDFTVRIREGVEQTDSFPSGLLALLGLYGIDLAVTRSR